jgi:hypothetical protein
MLIYLGICAAIAFGYGFLLLLVGEASVLASAHLVLAVGVLPLIFGAMAHFVPVLTRSGAAPRFVALAPLALQFAGGLAFLYFSGGAGNAALHVAATIALAVCVGFVGWLVSRARRTLGQPHPGWRWYLASLAALALGLALVPLLTLWPESRQALRLLHLHLNLLGFIGLAAIGTLQVLLPTVLSGPDADAAARLRSDLPWAVGGVLAVAFGAAFWWPLAPLGALLLAGVTCRLGGAWWRRHGLRALVGDGAAGLVAALCGFLLLLIFGVAHAVGLMDGHDAVPAFFAAFLLPLVTGALSQLLPVWRYPGRRTAVRERMREVLVYGGAFRAALFIAGGVLLAAGWRGGLWPTAVALLLFLFALLRAFFK